MSQSLTRLEQSERLQVQQQKEWTEIITDWETKNRYLVTAEDGTPLFHAGETGSGAMAVLTRGFLKNRRPFTIEVRDDQGQPALTVQRPWSWWLSRAEMLAPDGTVIGRVQQRWAWFSRRFTLFDRQGREVAEIHGSIFHRWTFELMVGGKAVGKIAKKWSGLLKEAFSDADNFGIELGPEMNSDLRLITLGATFLIDFLYFEDSD